MAADAPPDPPAAAALPDAVYVQTSTRATTTKLEYAVIDGRVFTKAKGAPASAWRPIDHDDGRPDRQNLPSDRAPIASISADDDGISAVTSNGYVVRYSSEKWDGLWGLPLPGVAERLPVFVGDGVKSLAHSVRRGDVQYYEDTLGNQFNWGFAGTTSLYALASDGRRILLGDPWLAPDLSRQVCGPRRGSFRAVSLAASASTLFVIAPNGEMYTRFFDYDSSGGTPMINFEYFDRAPRHGLSGLERNSEYEVRALPAEEWTREPDVVLEGLARLTRHIAILQNGQGNAARELRVQGTDVNGDAGYYRKSLRAKEWTFEPTPTEKIEDTAWLLPVGDEPELVRPRPLDFVYEGTAQLGERRDARIDKIDVRDFHFHCSPFHMTVHVAGGGLIELTLHTVDAWTPFAQGDAETDPRAYRSMKGTLAVDSIVRPPDGGSKVFDAVVGAFQRLHLKSFAVGVVASQRSLELVVLHPVLGVDPFAAELHFTRAGPPREVTPLPASTGNERADLRQLIVRAERARVRARKELADEVKALRTGIEAKLTSAFLNWSTTVTTTRYWKPDVAWINALDQHMPGIAETMLRAQRHEARDARIARDEELALIAPVYCALYERVAPELSDNTLRDPDLLARCPEAREAAARRLQKLAPLFTTGPQ